MAAIDEFYFAPGDYVRSRKPSLLARIRTQLATWRRRARERRLLAMLTERDLRELGLNRSQLEFEINKSVWEK